MKAFVAFARKELMEALRTRKFLVLFVVFLLLGMMNPLFAKLVPVLLREFMPAGIEITLGEPGALDSWTQFFKNLPQTGFIVLVIMYSGVMANEISRGTLINLLTKGLPRRMVILAKYAVSCLVFSVCYAACFGVSYGYTAYLWPAQGVPHLALSVSCLWLFGLMLLAALVLGGVLFSSVYGSLLFTGGFVMLMTLAGIIPALQSFLPMRLASDNMSLLTGALAPGDFYPAVLAAVVLTLVFVSAAVLAFDKKQV